MYSLKDGTELTFEIQRSYGTGDMSAQNPKTGEKFTGQYTATRVAGNYADAHGILRGNKGTVVNVTLEIQAGLMPKGHGEGVDNNGNRYQFQF